LGFSSLLLHLLEFANKSGAQDKQHEASRAGFGRAAYKRATQTPHLADVQPFSRSAEQATLLLSTIAGRRYRVPLLQGRLQMAQTLTAFLWLVSKQSTAFAMISRFALVDAWPMGSCQQTWNESRGVRSTLVVPA
jgi:hypothetical protein